MRRGDLITTVIGLRVLFLDRTSSMIRRLILPRRPDDKAAGSPVGDHWPRKGDYFSFRTSACLKHAQPSGRFAVLKVLDVGDSGPTIAVLAGTWEQPPTLRDARCARLLERRAFKSGPGLQIDHDVFRCYWWAWCPDLLPEVRFLGNDRLRGQERRALLKAVSFTGVAGAAVSAEREWRWLHDREALLQDVKNSMAAHQTEARAKAVAQRARRKTLNWEQLISEIPFPDWDTGPYQDLPETFVSDSREVVRAAYLALRALGPRPPRKEVRVILRRCVEWFNSTSTSYGPPEAQVRAMFVQTIEEAAWLAGQSGMIGEINGWYDD